MTVSKYIYTPTTVSGIQALYNNPDNPPGFLNTTQLTQQYKILSDRYIGDTLELPYKYKALELAPSELAISSSIIYTIDKLNENFAYLCSRSVIASNILPSGFEGYYSNTGGTNGLPIFKAVGTGTTLTVPPTAFDTAGALSVDTNTPKLSATSGGNNLNDLISGVWLRDNSLISIENADYENFHYGFLASRDQITVVKMSANPIDQTSPSYGPDGHPDATGGWRVLDQFKFVENLPSDKNKLYFTNIKSVKKDHKKYIYVLDSGNPRTGVVNVSDSSQRGVIYKYDVSGYIEPKTDYTIEQRQLKLVLKLGDMNAVTNVSDVVNPVAFTIDEQENIIIYDEHDFTFKVFDKNNNFVAKHPKRNMFFRGASGTEKTYIGVQDLHYDIQTKTYYVLSSSGIIHTMDVNFNVLEQIVLEKGTSNQTANYNPYDQQHPYYNVNSTGDPSRERFISLKFSENESNSWYIMSDRRVIKRFKSRNKINVATYNFLDVGIGLSVTSTGLLGWRAKLQFIDILQDAKTVTRQYTNPDGEIINILDENRSYTYDQIYIYTDFINLRESSNLLTDIETNNRFILNMKERVTLKSCLTQPFFDIYNISAPVKTKEYTSDIVYNKMFYKIIRNHDEFIKRLSFRLTANYTPTGELVYVDTKYLQEHEHRSLLQSDESNEMFVGINEYLSTSVLNRIIKNIYQLQLSILKILQTHKNNKWPVDDMHIAAEPYLYTNGDQFTDIDGIPYKGYYYIREQPGGDIPIIGRFDEDGLQLTDGSPSTDRYLTIISTG